MQREAKMNASPKPNATGAPKVFGAPPPQANIGNKETKIFGAMPNQAKSPNGTPIKTFGVNPSQNTSQNPTPTKFQSKRLPKAPPIEPEPIEQYYTEEEIDKPPENNAKLTQNTPQKQQVVIDTPKKEDKKAVRKSGIPVKKLSGKSNEAEKKPQRTSKIPTPKGKKQPTNTNAIKPAIKPFDMDNKEEPEIDENTEIYETDSDEDLYQAQFFRAGTPRPEKIPTESKKLMEHIDDDDFNIPPSTQKKAVVIVKEDTEIVDPFPTPASAIPKRQPSTPKSIMKDDVPMYDDSAADDLFEGLVQHLKASKGFKKVAAWQKAILSSLLPLEGQQLQRWTMKTLSYLESAGFEIIDGCYMEDIMKKVQYILDHHRVAGIGGLHSRMRVLIDGPQHSGKSAMLSLLAKKAVIELAAGELWKRTFVFAFDFNEHAHANEDQVRLYECIVHSTFEGLSAQMPLIARHAQALAKAFTSAAGGHPLLPRAFTLDNDFKPIVPQFQELINLISESFRDRKETDAFLANAVQLPRLISKFLGFDHVLIVADHIDALGSAGTVVEHVKQLLDMHSFLISGRDMTILEELLKPLDADCVDLTHAVFHASTLDVVEAPSHADSEFLLSFEGGGAKLPLGVEIFGGCAAFLARWEEFNAIADDAERLMEGDEDDQDIAAEKLLLLQSRIQAALPEFICGEIKPIINVSRVTRK